MLSAGVQNDFAKNNKDKNFYYNDDRDVLVYYSFNFSRNDYFFKVNFNEEFNNVSKSCSGIFFANRQFRQAR